MNYVILMQVAADSVAIKFSPDTLHQQNKHGQKIDEICMLSPAISKNFGGPKISFSTQPMNFQLQIISKNICYAVRLFHGAVTSYLS